MMSSVRIPVLAYHSHHIGTSYSTSDQIALAEDLRTIDGLDFRVIPLRWVAEWVLGLRDDADVQRGVAITFDDGADFDYRILVHPVHGQVPSFYQILTEFAAEAGARQPTVHGTAFVIASPDVRTRLDKTGLHGEGWVSDGWWADANATGVIEIQNHSWDHNHPTATRVCQGDQEKGTFRNIHTFAECDCEVSRAAEYIASKAGRWPDIFGYPYGESSDYIRREYFPKFTNRHRTIVAFGGTGGYVTRQSDPWNLERFVCTNRLIGWETRDQFVGILKGAE